MISREDVLNLSRLARIGVSEGEVEKLQNDLQAILGYVSELDTLSLNDSSIPVGDHKNVMREDSHPHDPGMFTEDLLAASAESKNGYFVVRQVIEK